MPLLLLAAASCSTSYMTHRARDASDILTVAFGDGAGATARVGPVHAGLLYTREWFVLKSGEGLSCSRYDEISGTLDPLIVLPNLGGGPWVFYHQYFDGGRKTVPGFHGKKEKLSGARGKQYRVSGNGPFIAIPVLTELDRRAGYRYPVCFLTDVEVAAGLVKTLRISVNPGELLDFVLGWTTLDFPRDDYESRF